MVSLVEDLEAVPNNKVTNTVAIQHLYAFALNRYNINLPMHHLMVYYSSQQSSWGLLF